MLEALVIGIFVTFAMFNVNPASKENKELEKDQAVPVKVVEITDWSEVTRSAQFVSYLSSGNMLIYRGTTRVWRLTDYAKPQIEGDFVYRSKRVQEEYDCREGLVRQRYVSLHDGNMAAGELLYARTETDAWEAVRLGSDHADMWRRVCPKR